MLRPPMLLQLLMLGIGFAVTVFGREVSYRIVVTFLTVRDNNITGVDLTGIKVVKRYGRRLVLDMGKPYDLKVQRLFFQNLFKSVQRVEPDLLVGIMQVDIGQIIINDTLSVSPLDMTMNANNPEVDGVYIDSASQTPLWNLLDSEPYGIRVEGIWKVTNSTPDVVVAVIDTGVAAPAKDLFLNLMDGYDFISDDWLSLDGDERDSDATDPGDWGDSCPVSSWHGTKVTSILAARHDNEWGMKGVAQNCSVLPVRALGMCRMGYASDVADAIVWAAGGSIDGIPINPHPAQIISLSLAGQGECPDFIQSAVDQARNLGSVVIAAAGNNNQNASQYFPANCKGVVAVAASTRDGKLAGYSNWGEVITLSAPGGDPTNAIMTLSLNALETGLDMSFGIGTSFAVPHVAGARAIYESVVPTKYYPLFITPKFLSFVVNISCAMNFCGGGILSLGKIKLENFNNTFIESLARLNVSDGLTMGQSASCCRLNTDPAIGGALTVPKGRECNPTSSSSYIHHDNWRYVICIDVRDCQTGKYQDVENEPYCKTCPTCNSGSYWANACGGVSAGTCTACTCNSGNYWSVACGGNSAGTCTACTCNSGSYWSVACGGNSAGTCTPCGSCAAGTYRNGCSGISSGTCTACTCNSGSYWSVACGGNSAGTCTPCGSCAAGTYRNGCSGTSPGTCTNCPAGTYRATAGATASSDCTACGPGKYSTSTGGASEGSCAACSTVTNCAPGNYREGCGGNSTGSCASCASCSTGFYRSSCSSLSAGACCQNTDQGFYRVSCATTPIRTACPTGFYCTGTSDPIQHTVTTCPAGQYLSTVPSATTNGQCSQCPAGTYKVGTSAATACTSCSAGFYSAATGAVAITTCTTCPQSSYCPAGASAPTSCPAGTRGLATQSSTSSNCANCTAGTSSAAGSASCTPCADGTYSAEGAATCTACVEKSCLSFQYKVGCTSTSDITCARCADPPANALTTAPTDPTCPWTCNTGYYRSSSTCVACTTTSTDCSTGQYREQCADGGTADGQCITCTNGPVNSVYTEKSTTGGTSNCPYDCNSPYVKDSSTGFCCTLCNNGYYNPSCTKTSSGSCNTCSN